MLQSKKEIPILFSTEMVKAILEGRKTQTRRVVKPQPEIVSENEWHWKGTRPKAKYASGASSHYGPDVSPANDVHLAYSSPYGKPGDLLWVRESFATIFEGFEYKADDGRMIAGVQNINLNDKYKPSIHMPKAVARIWLEVVSVRVERLQDISEVDAISEGVMNFDIQWCFDHFPEYKKLYEESRHAGGRPPLGPSPYMRFRQLWKSINGAESWDANPWCWVVEFKKTEKP